MEKYRLIFKCGAVLPHEGYCDEKPILNKNNGRILVHNPKIEHGSIPALYGKTMPCLFHCPAKQRESKRKAERGYGEDNQLGWYVTCVPTIEYVEEKKKNENINL